MNEDLNAIQRVLRGDAQAFRSLVDRHQDKVVRYAFTFLSRHDAAEDIAQDVFLAAFRKLDSYDASRSAFLTWLLTITRNRCLNSLKRKHHEVAAELPEPATARTPVDVVGEQEFLGNFSDLVVFLGGDGKVGCGDGEEAVQQSDLLLVGGELVELARDQEVFGAAK